MVLRLLVLRLYLIVGIFIFSSSCFSMMTEQEEGKESHKTHSQSTINKAKAASGSSTSQDEVEGDGNKTCIWGMTGEEVDQVFRTSNNLVAIIEGGGRFKRLNPKWSEVLGWTQEELMAKPFHEFVHPDDQENTLRYVLSAERHVPQTNFVNRYRHKDGTDRYLKWSLFLQQRDSDKPVFFIMAIDITLEEVFKKSSREQISLLNSQIQLKTSLVKSLVELQQTYLGELAYVNGVAEKTFHHVINHFNHLTESEFGFIAEKSKKEGDDRTVSIVYKWAESNVNLSPGRQEHYKKYKDKETSQAALSCFNDYIRQVYESKKPFIANDISLTIGIPFKSFLGLPLMSSQREMIGVLALLNHPHGFSEQLVEWIDPLLVIAGRIVKKIYLKKFYEESTAEQSRARERAEAGSQSKSTFLAHMSHELRTPLTGIIGLLDLIDKEKLSAEDTGYLQMARGAGESLLSIINDILDFSKIEQGKLKLEKIEFNPFRAAQDVIQLLNFSAKEKGLSLCLNIDPSIPDILIGDPTRIRQILLNLIGNAIKFTEKGSVEVFLKGKKKEKEDQYLLVGDVVDTGIGIKPESIASLFQPFAQADESMSRRFGGSGLGLTISANLCRLMGGNVSITQTKQGVGSTFHFEIYLEAAKTKVSPKSPPKTIITKLPRLNILVAEDNKVNQTLMQAMLKRGGCESVTTVQNGAEALKALDHPTSLYDVILMDGQMPVMDGLEATRQIRVKYPHRKIIIIGVTAHALMGDRERFIDAGMDGYVTKPIMKETLYSEILRCLDAKEQIQQEPGASAFVGSSSSLIETHTDEK